MKKIMRWVAVVVALTVAVALAGLWMISKEFESEVAARLYIPKGASKESVRDSMVTSLGDEYGSLVYRLWAVASGDPSRSHGSYVVEPGASATSTANAVAKGCQTPVRVTLNNMRTLDDLFRKVAAKVEATPQELRDAADKVLAADSNYHKPQEFAAAFVPDTYEFYWTDSPERVIAKLVAYRDKFWTPERMSKAERLGLTPVEVATIASIVEEESNKEKELPMIARLYMNRVKKGMKLQADPTVKFAVGDFSLRRITGKHLQIDSPYNTYKNTGLPPGPIRIARKSTIDAVLNAPEHNYLYMCAKEDFSGYHNFAADYDTHVRNAQRYRAELNRRGIR